jgi:hypothetical protein
LYAVACLNAAAAPSWTAGLSTTASLTTGRIVFLVPFDDPRVRVHVEDGRFFLLAAPRIPTGMGTDCCPSIRLCSE